MSIIILAAAQALVPGGEAAEEEEILVTAARIPVAQEEIGVSATLFGEARIEALGLDDAADFLRLMPGVDVAATGARGTQTQVRVRGAEANHTLLFVDGIRFNDPAAGNEPRFEILTADGLARIELVRGPQSALWGSEAIGGVIALSSPDPLGPGRTSLAAEYGGDESLRAAVGAVLGGDTLGAALTAAHGRSAGIDIVGGGAGDEDGFSTTTLGLKAAARAGGELGFGLAARYVDHLSEFDGFDPVSFLRADTRDESRTETAAVRLHAGYGAERAGPWTLVAAAQYLWSGNRNFLADDPLNRSEGERRIFSLQGERRFALGGTRHALIAAAEHEEEGFKARDRVFFGATDQDRDRRRAAFVGEWRAEWNSWLSSDIALRRDDFGDFEDATTLRALARAELGEGFSIRGAYGEGIAQPTFFDLHGFFPGSFIGNPALKPESSRGHELGLRWQGARAAVAATLFRHDLEDEIVTVFDPATFLSSAANAAGRSERRGIELAAAAQPASGLEIGANYSWLDAGEPQLGDGLRLREPRRAKHSGNIFFDYRSGGFAAGGALAYVGERRDTDFDIFEDVVLDPYWLASLRLGYRLAENVEAYARVENGFDEDYREVAGYATPGRTFHAGLRFSLGD